MAKKSKTPPFVCESCAAEFSKWQGMCDTCKEWNTIVERKVISSNLKQSTGSKLNVQPIKSASKQKTSARFTSGFSEVDDVLGGGIVAGSVVLMAGEPGIGKSTLLLQLAHNVAAKKRVAYVSAEESAAQIGLRSERLDNPSDRLGLATTTSADDIVATLQSAEYDVVIVDSIQTIAHSSLTSNPGTVSQITTCAHILNEAAKASNTTLIVVGHVTKDGTIAGPKVLEHLVDVVLNLEGDRYGGYKVLRSVKNRFGSTNEVALFEMENSGLVPISNPSEALLSERQVTDGSVVLATMEGSRPLLVEVQALVTPTQFGYPKRTASGFDLNRLNVLIAVLTRRTKLSLGDKDIYVNIVGGIRLSDQAADLAVAMAIGSASKGYQLKDNLVVFGELGLSGEVRHVPMVDKRLAEAKKLGFDGAVGPSSVRGKADSFLRPVKSIRDALNEHLEK